MLVLIGAWIRGELAGVGCGGGRRKEGGSGWAFRDC